ncbi:hypothetical protein ACVW19_006936 [Streptomyces sp. TE5632]
MAQLMVMVCATQKATSRLRRFLSARAYRLQ